MIDVEANPYAAPESETEAPPRPSRLPAIFNGMLGGLFGSAIMRVWIALLPVREPREYVLGILISATLTGLLVLLCAESAALQAEKRNP